MLRTPASEPPARRLTLVMGVHPFVRAFGAVLTAVSLILAWNLATASSPPMDAPKVRVLSVVLFVAGEIFLFGLRGAVIDPARGRVVRWWGPTFFGLLRVPLFWRRHALSAFTSVVRRRLVHQSNSDGVDRSYETFAVVLAGNLPRAVKMWEGHSLLRARRRAETIAGALRLPLIDEVDGGPTRSPDELDVDALERLMKQQGGPPVSPSTGMGSRSRAAAGRCGGGGAFR